MTTTTAQRAPIDEVLVTKLTGGGGGYARRFRHRTLVFVSDALPEWAQDNAIGALLRRVHSGDPAALVDAGLSADEALRLPTQRGNVSVRR